jgi:hypothetical protein
MKVEVLSVLLLVMVAAGCESGNESALRTFDGAFECTEVDGDIAVLIWDGASSHGYFGFQPSNGGDGNLVVREITSLNIDETFPDVYGLDASGVAETARIRLSLVEGDAGFTGTGTLERSGTTETCTATFVKPDAED